MDKAKDKDKVNVLVQVKTGDQTHFVALSLKKAKVLSNFRSCDSR
jgi:hypothetical protein